MPANRKDEPQTSPHLRLDIRSMKHLALRLAFPLEILENVAEFLPLQYDASRSHPKREAGKVRTIDAPRFLLKRIQRRINEKLLQNLWLPDIIHAYRRGRSVRSALKPHEGARFLWVADVRSFYPSISFRAVYKIFSELGCTADVARLLTRLTTHRHCLPQGAPTSPLLANLHMRFSGLAARLEGIASQHHLAVTVFGDDILLSGREPFGGLEEHLTQIIGAVGLRLNTEKTSPVRGPKEQHMALKLITNSRGDELNVLRSYRRRLQSLLDLCRRHGPHALAAVGITKDPRAYLAGKIAFAKYVNPRNARFEEDPGWTPKTGHTWTPENRP